LPKLLVFNNGVLGFIELEQKSTGFLNFGTEFNNPNFAAMAEAIPAGIAYQAAMHWGLDFSAIQQC
jgi:thiamine pyrophosphate-dependent acetolactate synthase large subunit-like protein